MNLLLALVMTATPAADMERALAPLDSDLEPLASAACAHASGYQVADTWADPERLRGSSPAVDRLKARTAFAVLATLCGQGGADVAVKRLRKARTLRDDAWKQLLALPKPKGNKPDPKAQEYLSTVDGLFSVERQALASFGKAGDRVLVDDLLPRLQDDEPLQLLSIDYFIQTAPRDPAILNELYKLRANTKSQPLLERIDAYLKL